MVSLSGTSGVLTIANTAASTSSSTGCLQLAGGLYAGAGCVFNAGIQIPTGASNGYLLTSDASGNASWVAPAAFPSSITGPLTITGTSSYLSLTGSSSYLALSNTTASTSSSTGSIQSAGGAYLGAASLCAGTFKITDTTQSTSPTTGSFQTLGGVGISKDTHILGTLHMYGAASQIQLTGATSLITLSNTAGSTSSSSGAIQCAGGLYCGGASIFNAGLTLNSGLKITTSPSNGYVLTSDASGNASWAAAGIPTFSSGTVGAPGVAFASDTTTGLYLSSAGVLGIAAGGVNPMLFTSTYITSSVYINLPAGSLSTPSLNFGSNTGIYSSGTGLIDLSVSGNHVAQYTATSEVFFYPFSVSDSTASTSNSTGCAVLYGGLGIKGSTNATSNTNGGSLTTAGGIAAAKDVYVGGTLYYSLTSIPLSASVYSSSSQVISSGGSGAQITLGSTYFDYSPSNYMSTTTSNAITIKTTGIYRVEWRTSILGTTNAINFYINKNSTTYNSGTLIGPTFANFTNSLSGSSLMSATVQLTAGDIIRAYAYAASVNYTIGGGIVSCMTVIYVSA